MFRAKPHGCVPAALPGTPAHGDKEGLSLTFSHRDCVLPRKGICKNLVNSFWKRKNMTDYGTKKVVGAGGEE